MIGRAKFVLASGSPRRLALINQAGIEPDALRPADIDETPKKGELPRACATRLARSKAEAALTLLRQGGSRVTQGNLITLPVGGGLLYFEPVYVSQAAPGSSGAYPTLQGMLAYYNGQVGYGSTLAPNTSSPRSVWLT